MLNLEEEKLLTHLMYFHPQQKLVFAALTHPQLEPLLTEVLNGNKWA